MEEKIKVFDLEECEECPFKALEINKIYYFDNEPYYETALIKCVHFDSCKRLETIFKEQKEQSYEKGK